MISAAVISPNLLPKRHGDWHTHRVAVSSEPRVSGSFPEHARTPGTQEFGGPRRKGPPCHRAGHEFFGNISVCKKLIDTECLGSAKSQRQQNKESKVKYTRLNERPARAFLISM